MFNPKETQLNFKNITDSLKISEGIFEIVAICGVTTKTIKVKIQQTINMYLKYFLAKKALLLKLSPNCLYNG